MKKIMFGLLILSIVILSGCTKKETLTFDIDGVDHTPTDYDCNAKFEEEHKGWWRDYSCISTEEIVGSFRGECWCKYTPR